MACSLPAECSPNMGNTWEACRVVVTNSDKHSSLRKYLCSNSFESFLVQATNVFKKKVTLVFQQLFTLFNVSFDADNLRTFVICSSHDIFFEKQFL
jgi:hypothetical protein